ncbi:MAG: hypothetical protein V3W37_03190 [Candidatus Binatia bacterium]
MPLKKGDVNIVLSLDSEGAVKGVKNFGKEIETTSKRAESSIGGIESALIGVGAVIGLRELKNKIIGLADEAAFAHQSMKVLGDVTEAFGQSGEEAIGAAEDLADGMFSVFDAATSLRNLIASGLELPKAIELMETLKNSAAANRRASLTLAQQIISTTEGIRNQNSVLADNSGITKNVNRILIEYAQAHGTTVAKLDRFTQAQVIANGFIEEGAVFLGQYEAQMQGYIGAQGEATVAAQELRIEIGTQLHDAMTDLYGQFAGWTQDITEFAEAHENLGIRVGGATGTVTLFAGAAGLGLLVKRLGPTTALLAAAAALVGDFGADLIWGRRQVEGFSGSIKLWQKELANIKAQIEVTKETMRGLFTAFVENTPTTDIRSAATIHAEVYAKEIERYLTDDAVGLGNAVRIAWSEAEGFFPLQVPIEFEVGKVPFAFGGAVPTGGELPGVAAVIAAPSAIDQKALDARLKLEKKLQDQIASLILTGREFKERQLEIEIEAYRKAGIDRVTVEGESFDLTEFEMLKHIDFSKATAEERAAIEKDLQDQIRALKLSAFDNDRAILAEQVEALRAAEVDGTAIIEFEALRRAEIRQAEAEEAARLAKLAATGVEDEWSGATDIISDGFTDMRHSIVNDFDSLGDAAGMIARRMLNSFIDLLFDPFEDRAAKMGSSFAPGGGGGIWGNILSFLPFFGSFLGGIPGPGMPGGPQGPPNPSLPALPGGQLVVEGDRNIDLRHSVIFSPDRRAGFDAVYRDEIKRSEIDHDERF